MLTRTAKVFRQENKTLFSDSESESEYVDSDIEDLDQEQSFTEREESDLNSLNFEKVEKERKCSGRPSRLRRAYYDLPKPDFVDIGTIKGLLSKILKKTVFINAVRSRYSDLFSRAREESEHLCHFRLIVSGLKKFVMLS